MLKCSELENVWTLQLKAHDGYGTENGGFNDARIGPDTRMQRLTYIHVFLGFAQSLTSRSYKRWRSSSLLCSSSPSLWWLGVPFTVTQRLKKSPCAWFMRGEGASAHRTPETVRNTWRGMISGAPALMHTCSHARPYVHTHARANTHSHGNLQ